MKVTAVVLHYYSKRKQNIQRIITDLKNSSRPPNRIIIFNNNPETTAQDLIKDKDVICINSSFGFLGRAKYIACLLDFADYYVLIDDDITVGKETIKHLLSVAEGNKTFCTAQQGIILNGKSMQERITITDSEISKPTPTETLIGSFIFCSFSAIVKMLSYEEECRKMVKSHNLHDELGDDLLMGFANAPIIIYPAKEDEKVIDLPDGGVVANLLYPEGVFTSQRDRIAPFIKDLIDRKNGR